MDRTAREYELTEGIDVYGSDGDKVGSIVAVQPSYVVVEKGFFFPTDYYVPRSAIAGYDDGKVYLNVTKDAALNQGWDLEPIEDGTSAATAAGGYGTELSGAGAGVVDRGTGVAATAQTDQAAAGETVRVPVDKEELTATKRPREVGPVRVEKDVVTEERTLDVPVTEERARVERRAVDRPIAADQASAFEEGVVEVPLRGEAVDVGRRTRVAEEIEIGKDATQRTEQVGGTVRREEVRVHEDVVEGLDAAESETGRQADRGL